MKLTTFAMLAVAALFAGAAFAADSEKDSAKTHTVTLRSGKVLQEAYILDKKPNGITVAFKDGCMFIPFSDMPLEYQQKFGYDPIKSARYEKKLKDQQKIREIEETARKKGRQSERPTRTSITRTDGSAPSSRRCANLRSSSKRQRSALTRPKRP